MYGTGPNQYSPWSDDVRPIHLALKHGQVEFDIEIFKALIEWRADINAYSVVAGHPLQTATVKARDLLLQAGAGPGRLPKSSKPMTEREKVTKLQMAAGSGDAEHIRLLISNDENCQRGSLSQRRHDSFTTCIYNGPFQHSTPAL